MGELIKIVDLVHDMIRLSGLSLDDIEIRYTGVRPGEKLYEELRFDEEELMPTKHPKLQTQYHRPYDPKSIRRAMRELRAAMGSNALLRSKLCELVPEYRPQTDVNGSKHAAMVPIVSLEKNMRTQPEDHRVVIGYRPR
jgi:FlaA1/EpsC-like NDP-sugar epimerase